MLYYPVQDIYLQKNFIIEKDLRMKAIINTFSMGIKQIFPCLYSSEYEKNKDPFCIIFRMWLVCYMEKRMAYHKRVDK